MVSRVWKGKSSPSKGSWGQTGCEGGECSPGLLITAGELPARRACSAAQGKGQRGETKSGRCQWDTGHTVTNSRGGARQQTWCHGHTYLQIFALLPLTAMVPSLVERPQVPCMSNSTKTRLPCRHRDQGLTGQQGEANHALALDPAEATRQNTPFLPIPAPFCTQKMSKHPTAAAGC